MKNLLREKLPSREWKKVVKTVYFEEIQGDLEKVCKNLKEKAKGLKNPTITVLDGYEGAYELEITGFVRKTNEEIESYDNNKKQQKERYIKRQEDKKNQEIKELKRLKSKYPHFS